MKKCNNQTCESKGKLLPYSEYSTNKQSKDGLHYRCKSCIRKSVKISMGKKKEYYLEQSRLISVKHREENPEYHKEMGTKFNQLYKENGYYKNYYQENKERISEYHKREDVVEKRKKRWKERYYTDEKFRLKGIITSNFHSFFKDKGLNKNISFSKIVDYTYGELKTHLENNFRKGMSWDNLGELWEIHHIKPQSIFNPLNRKEVRECWEMSNLIPLWTTTEISQMMGDNVIGNRNVEKDKIYHP